MAFTPVTITADFDLPTGALGTVSFTPAEPMHNSGKTVAGTVTATLDNTGALSQLVDATTDPNTTPLGVPYRVVLRVSGQPPTTWFLRVPHNQGSTLDLGTLLAWASSGTSGGVVTSVNGHTGAVVLDADDLADGDVRVMMTASERTKLGAIPAGATIYTAANTRDDMGAALVAGANVVITPAGSGNTRTYTIASTATGGSGGGGYGTVQDEGAALTVRSILNFVGAGVTVTDDPGNARTLVTIPGGGGGGSTTTVPHNTQTASYTLALTDAGQAVEVNSASAATVTVPPNSSVAFPVDTVLEVAGIGTGAVTLVAGSGVTLRTPTGTLQLRGQYSTVGLRQRAVNDWILTGDLS